MSEQLSDPRETDLSAQESREPKAWWACVVSRELVRPTLTVTVATAAPNTAPASSLPRGPRETPTLAPSA